MAMFMPNQSESGGVIVNPYLGNLPQELQFLTEKKDQARFKTSYFIAGFTFPRTQDAVCFEIKPPTQLQRT